MGVTAVAHLSGSVDLYTVDQARAELTRALADAEECVIVDLADVTYLDSIGVGALLDAAREARELGTRFVLRQPPDRVRRVLELLGLTEILPVADGDQPH